jgi:DNA primase
MPIFAKESLELLRDKIDLVEVISSFVDLKKSGSSYKGLCPFHGEKTPSFIVRKGDSHYHCFGCSAHGDAIEFLMSYQKLTFVEAVENLAERFNVFLKRKEGDSLEKVPYKPLLKEVLQKASLFFHFMLLHTEEGKKALSYLYKRGITLNFIKTFEIGYAPRDLFLLKKFFEKQNVKLDILEKAGLIKREGKSFFIDRIIIPIKDFSGAVIGFSARKFKESTFGPKYINTQETPLFKKSKVLFGFSYSRKKIAKERRAIVVEGQFDALRLIYEGISIAVAGQGTAFGKTHVNELLKLGIDKVYLALDGDKAGVEASIKIGDLFQKEAVEVFVVRIPLNLDPDTYIKENGANEFIKLIKKAKDYLTFLVEEMSKKFDIKSPSGKNKLVKSLMDRIKNWDHPLMVHESLRKIARLTNTPESVVEGFEENTPNVYVEKTQSIRIENFDPDRILETDLLRWLLLVSDSGKRFLEIVKLNLKEEDFKVGICRKFFEKYVRAFEENEGVDLLSLAIDLEDAEEQLFISEILQKKVNREKAEKGFMETLQKILNRNWMEKREDIKVKIQSGNCSEEEILEFVKKFDEIKNKRPEIVFKN